MKRLTHKQEYLMHYLVSLAVQYADKTPSKKGMKYFHIGMVLETEEEESLKDLLQNFFQ